MSSNSTNILLSRYDSFFGKGTSNKLLKIQRELAKNQFIRVNLSKTSVDKVKNFLKDNRVKFSDTFFDNCIKIEKSFFNLSSSILCLTGDIYLQDLASQIPVNLVDFDRLKSLRRKVRVLDMAASPGSKTTQICDLFNYKNIDYELVALEPDNKRLVQLFNNLQKQIVNNVDIFNVIGEEFVCDKKFDLILLDAPCSGNLISDKNWLNKRDLRGIRQRSEIQKKLLKKAELLLEKNGELIYSTCSLEPEENEGNVKWILKNSSLKILDKKFEFKFRTNFFKDQKGFRFMPYESKTQGFFVCCFRK